MFFLPAFVSDPGTQAPAAQDPPSQDVVLLMSVSNPTDMRFAYKINLHSTDQFRLTDKLGISDHGIIEPGAFAPLGCKYFLLISLCKFLIFQIDLQSSSSSTTKCSTLISQLNTRKFPAMQSSASSRNGRKIGSLTTLSTFACPSLSQSLISTNWALNSSKCSVTSLQ